MWLGLVGKNRVGWVGRNGKGNRASERDNVFKPIIASDFIFSLKCTKMFVAGLPPDPQGELKSKVYKILHSDTYK